MGWSALQPEESNTLVEESLDQAKSVLGSRSNPHGSNLIFWGLFFSFFLSTVLTRSFLLSFLWNNLTTIWNQ